MGTLTITIARGHTPEEVKALFPQEKVWATGRTWSGKTTLFALPDDEGAAAICSVLKDAFDNEIIDVCQYEYGKPGTLRSKFALRRRFWHHFLIWEK